MLNFLRFMAVQLPWFSLAKVIYFKGSRYSEYKQNIIFKIKWSECFFYLRNRSLRYALWWHPGMRKWRSNDASSQTDSSEASIEKDSVICKPVPCNRLCAAKNIKANGKTEADELLPGRPFLLLLVLSDQGNAWPCKYRTLAANLSIWYLDLALSLWKFWERHFTTIFQRPV